MQIFKSDMFWGEFFCLFVFELDEFPVNSG